MSSTKLLLGLLAATQLTPVSARIKDRVEISQFSLHDCRGPPWGSLLELKKGKCESIPMATVRIHRHHKAKYSKWINGINEGTQHCYVTGYAAPGCEGEPLFEVSMPSEAEACRSIGEGHASLRFWCKPRLDLQCGGSVTKRWVFPPINGVGDKFWDIQDQVELVGNDFREIKEPWRPDEDVIDGGYVDENGAEIEAVESGDEDDEDEASMAWTAFEAKARAEARAEADASTASLDASSADSDVETSLAARGKHPKLDRKGVWMKQPWSGSDVCYECYITKPLDYHSIQCHSGDQHLIDCGPRPSHVATRSVTITTATATVQVFYASPTTYSGPEELQRAVAVAAPAAAAVAPLDKRSPHKMVLFLNPWVPGHIVCGRARWRHEGKSNSEVRIHKTNEEGACHGEYVYLNADQPREVVTLTAHVEVTTTLGQAPAWAPVATLAA